MAIKLKRQAAGSVVTPPATHVAFFIDENGIPALMDGDGVVTPAVSADGSPLSLDETTAPAPELNKVKLYAKDVGGVSQPFFISDDGTENQIGALSWGTFYNDSQSASLDTTLLAGGSYTWETGIRIPVTGALPTNGALMLHLESRSIVEAGFGFDLGYVNIVFSWGTPPTVPGSITAFVSASSDVGTGMTDLLGSLIADISLDAANELVIALNSGKGNDVQVVCKATVTPVTTLPFSPV